MAKPRIKLLKTDIGPVHRAAYQGCLKTRELKVTEIDKMIAKNVIMSART